MRPEVAPRYCKIAFRVNGLLLLTNLCGKRLTEQYDHTAGWYWECPDDDLHAAMLCGVDTTAPVV